MPLPPYLQKNDTTQLIINDTIKTSKPSTIRVIKELRSSLDLSTFKRAKDSVKEVVKVHKPIKHTPPIAKQIDSLSSPVYNSFTGEFEFPVQQKNSFDFTFYDPATPKTTPSNPPPNKTKTEQKLFTEIKQNTVVSQTHKQQAEGFQKTDWMIAVLLFSFLLFGFLNIRFGKFIKTLLSASYNYFLSKNMHEERNIVRNNVFRMLNLLFFVNFAFLLALWTNYKHIKLFSQAGIGLFFIYFIALILIYGLKSLFFITLDFVFLTRKSFANYNATVFMYNKVYGIVLLPLLFFIPFVPENLTKFFFLLSLIVFISLYFARIIRGLQIGIKNKISIFYLILYLCTLEILPSLFIYHTIMEYTI